MSLRTLILWLLLVVLPPLAMASDEVDVGLADLTAAVEKHPDDADLLWLYARALVDLDRTSEAIERLERLVSRWPDRRPAAQLLLGQLLAEQERCAAALPHLRRAIALDPGLGAAHFHLGLCLRALGEEERAERHLSAAAYSEPGLRSETLLIRALSRIERGDPVGANAMLREAIELDPTSDVAESARLLLGEHAPRPEERRLRIEAYAGMEFDSNVTLDSGEIPGLNRNRTDGAGTWGTSISGDAYRGERVGLTLGARYDARRYIDLQSYDTDDLLAYFSARILSSERLLWRVDGLFSQGFLDDAPYLSRTQLRPNVLVILGERVGVARVYAAAEGLWFDDAALFPSLERDGYSFGAGLEHVLVIPGFEAAWAGWNFGYAHRLTDASSDLLGFRGDYDHDRVGGGIRAHLPLPLAVALDANLGVSGEIYRNENVLDFISTRVLQGLTPRKRRDVVLESGLRLLRPVTSYLDVELSWRFLERFSNTDIYAYDRHVVGVQFRVHGF